MKHSHLLSRLRIAIRTLFFVHGIGWFCAFVAALLAVIYVGDRMLDYPRGMRVLQICLFGPLLGYLFWRWVWRPIATPITTDDLGILIERVHPHSRERFLTMLQAESDPRIAATAHPELLAQVRREAEQALEGIGAWRVLRPKPALRSAALGVAALALLALGAWTQGELSGIFARRLLALDAPWPRRTELQLVLKDRQGELLLEATRSGFIEIELPRSNSLRVEVRALGDVPEEARFITGGARVDKVTRQSQDEDSTAHFVHSYRDITEDFEFWVEAGDDSDQRPTIRVRTYPVPAVRALWSQVEPPDYLPAPLARAARRAMPHGNVSALNGSAAEMVFLVEGECSRASVVLDPPPDASWNERELERLSDVPATPEGVELENMQGVGAFRLSGIPLRGERSFQVRLFLEDRRGRRPERPNVYVFTPQTDDAPAATVRLIGAPLRMVTPHATLLAVGEWSDDHDVAQAQFLVREDQFGARETRAEARVFESEVLSAARSFDESAFLAHRTNDARTRYQSVLSLRLSELSAASIPTQPGAALAVLARATDRRPDSLAVDSAAISVAVVDERELIQALATSLEEIRAEAELMRSNEQRFLVLLEETRVALGDVLVPGAWSPEDTRFERGEFALEGRRLAERFSGLAQTTVLNGIGLGLDDREAGGAQAAGEERIVAAMKTTLERALSENAGGSGETSMDLRLLDELGRDARSLSSRPPVVALLDIGKDFANLALREMPAAQDAARSLAATADPNRIVPALEQLIAAQRRVCETAQRICAGLHRWDSFESILLDFKRSLDNFLRFRRAVGDTDK